MYYLLVPCLIFFGIILVFAIIIGMFYLAEQGLEKIQKKIGENYLKEGKEKEARDLRRWRSSKAYRRTNTNTLQ